METLLPYVSEDFEVGERIYHIKGHKFVLGAVSKLHPHHISVRLDDGSEEDVAFSSFERLQGNIWGKALDLSRVSVGSRISNAWNNKDRTFATVIKFIPDEEIVLRIEGYGPKGKFYFEQPYTSQNLSLDWRLAKWELEE